MSFRSPLILSSRPSPKPKRRAGTASPLSKKKRPSPRSAEKVARPRRRPGVATDTNSRRGGKRRSQKEGKDEAAMFEEFHKDLNRLISWLTAAIDQSEQWKAPSNSTLSIRVQLEKYLAFAMEFQTHQHLKDSVVHQGQDLANAYPQLRANLAATVDLIATQHQRLEERLDSQFKQLQEALSSLEASTRSDSKSLRSFDAELIMDTIEQMSFRLLNSKRHNSPMEVSIKALNKQVDTLNSSNKLSSTGDSDTSCSSSPDFDVLYEELSDWLSELHMAVTDSQKGQSDQRMEQMFKVYTQELHLREVTRSKLNKKGNRLLAHRPSTTQHVTAKLQAINQQWASLQDRLTPPCPSGGASSPPPSLPVFASSEEVMTVTLEVEEVIVQLKGWLTEMERKLFAAESLKCPGSVEQMEKRLEAHKELQVDIAKNSEGIQVVLNMCDILQRDKHACANEKERESLQLAAFNLEGRWQAIQAQAMALQCSLEEKLRTFKGYSTFLDKGIQNPPNDKDTTDGENKPSPAEPTGLFPYRPSGAKDDSVLYSLGHGINYDDILLVREAFSENDAFSISDASEVSLGDFAFDDVLPLKAEDEEIPLSVPSQTPDIMELSDEMIDAYLKMEEEQLKLEEDDIDGGILPDVPEIRGRSNSELEFWSMSPREDPVMTHSVELPHVMPSLEDLDQEPVLLRKEHSIPKLSPSFNVDMSMHSLPNYRPITLERYSTETVDFMSLVVEDTLESLGSDDDEFEEDDVHEADDEDEEDVDVTLTEERCQNQIQDNVPNEDDEALGNLLFDMEDVDESIAATSPPPSMPVKHLSQSLPVTHRTLRDVDLPTHDYPSSYPSQPVSNTWSHPSVTIAKSPRQKRGFFPSHAGCLLPNPFEDVVTSSPVKEDLPNECDTSAALRKLRRRLSQVSNPLSDEEQKRRQKVVSPPPQDHLLEITDLSLSHMYESLDFVTELTNSLMPGAHPSRDGVDSPLEFPLLEKIEDSDSDSFSDSSEDIEREDLVQRWINENMPTPPQVIPLQMPPELPFNPLNNLQASVQEIPTQDLPSLPICDLEEIHLDQETSDILFSHSGPGIAQVQETDGFLESLSVEKEASQGHCTDAEEVDMADEEVTPGPAQQEVMNQYLHSSVVHKSSETLPESDSSASNDTDGSSTSADRGTLDFSAIKERLRQEIMEQPNKKHAYFTYVSKLAETCAVDTDLGRVLGEFNSQKCYLWAIGGALDQLKKPTTDPQDLPDTVSDNWLDVASQCSDETDKLLEASSSLVEELERGAHLQAKSLPEDEIGSWRDVIVLWLDEQSDAPRDDGQDLSAKHDITDGEKTGDHTSEKRSQQSQDREELPTEKNSEIATVDKSLEATDDGIIPDSNVHDSSLDITDCVDYIKKHWEPSADLIDSGNFSADGTLEDESLLYKVQDSPLASTYLSSTPKTVSANDDHLLTPSPSASPIHVLEAKEAASGERPAATPLVYVSPQPKESSYVGRILCLGLPICIFLFLCVLFVLLLPAVIVSTTGECSLSLTDNILLHSPSWEPLLRYVRGPPPQ